MATDYREPEVRSILDWDPSDTSGAESLADSGDMSSVGDLCERITADDRASGVLLQRTAIQRLPINFEGGDDRAIERLRDEGDFWRICPGTQLALLHRWYALLGIAPGRLRWVDERGKPLMRDGLHAPVVEAWSSSRHLSLAVDGGWNTQLYSGELVKITPGTDGWLLFAQAGSRPWAQGSWRACRLWWLLKTYAIQDWARYSERHGQGTWVVKPGESTDLKDKAARKALATEFKALGRDPVFITRPGWDVNLVEATANNFVTFKQQVQEANAGLAIAILGQNLSSEVKGGSYAAAQVHEAVAAHIIASDTDNLSDFVHDQILVPWAVANWGSADAAPWPKWDVTPPADTAGRVKTWVDLGAALTTFKTLGVPVDVTSACEAAGVPLEAAEDAPSLVDDEEDADTDEPPNPEAEPEGEEPDEGLPPAASAQACWHRHERPLAQRAGERNGQEYADRVARSLERALAKDLQPHIDAIMEMVGGATGPEDYQRVLFALEDYYREKMSPAALSEKVRRGLVTSQVGGWAAVREDAPELK